MAKQSSRRRLLFTGWLVLVLMMMLAVPTFGQEEGEAVQTDEVIPDGSAEEPPTPGEPVIEDIEQPPVPATQADQPPTLPVEEETVPVVTEDDAQPVPEEPVPEPTPEPTPQEEAVQEKEASKAKAVPAGVPTAKRAQGAIEEKANALLDRIKSISQSDAKKIAAAVVGVWGVSAGVGWIAQNANDNNNNIKTK